MENWVEGEFVPPEMGRSDVPIAIDGAGSLALTDHGVRVRGHKQPKRPLLTFLIYFGGLVVLGGVSALGFAFADSDAAKRAVKYEAMSAALSFWTVGAIYLRRKRREASARGPIPVDFTVPLTSVNKVLFEDNEIVLFRIRRFKPKGGLYFRPNDWKALHALVGELEKRGVKAV